MLSRMRHRAGILNRYWHLFEYFLGGLTLPFLFPLSDCSCFGRPIKRTQLLIRKLNHIYISIYHKTPKLDGYLILSCYAV